MEVTDRIIATTPEIFLLLSIAIDTIHGLGRFRSLGRFRIFGFIGTTARTLIVG
jgi:hypothetical protein